MSVTGSIQKNLSKGFNVVKASSARVDKVTDKYPATTSIVFGATVAAGAGAIALISGVVALPVVVGGWSFVTGANAVNALKKSRAQKKNPASAKSV